MQGLAWLTGLEALAVLFQAAALLAVAALVVPRAARVPAVRLRARAGSGGGQGRIEPAGGGSSSGNSSRAGRVAPHATEPRRLRRRSPEGAASGRAGWRVGRHGGGRAGALTPPAILGRKAFGLRSRIASTAACRAGGRAQERASGFGGCSNVQRGQQQPASLAPSAAWRRLELMQREGCALVQREQQGKCRPGQARGSRQAGTRA